MNPYNFYEAYTAVYDQDTREDLAIIEEDLSFVDDLSDNELVQIMEEILSEEEVTLQECIDIFDFELLSESDYMQSMMRAQNKKRAAEKSAAATAKREKSAERERVGRKHAMKRIQVAATRAGRNLADKAKAAGQKAKTLGAGAASAAAGGATEAGRKVTRKLASAKQKIKGLVKSGRKAVAGGLRAAAAKVEPKETAEKSTPVGTSGKTTTSSDSRRTAAALKLARAAEGQKSSGTVQQGQPAGTFKSKKSREQARKREARLTTSEAFELLDLVVSDLISEGHAQDADNAYDIINTMDMVGTCNLIESYIQETDKDVYDIVLEHLVVEGYADTLEQAEVIMVNMSEDWRNEIIDEAQIMSVSGKGGLKHMINPKIVRAQNAAARERQGRQERENQAKNTANAERSAQARKASIQRLNAKPGADSGDYDSGYHGDDDTSGGKRNYSLSRTNRSARKRRASGR
jgi:hypothetical protein